MGIRSCGPVHYSSWFARIARNHRESSRILKNPGLSRILSGILSGILSAIFPAIFPAILSRILPGILPGILPRILFFFWWGGTLRQICWGCWRIFWDIFLVWNSVLKLWWRCDWSRSVATPRSETNHFQSRPFPNDPSMNPNNQSTKIISYWITKPIRGFFRGRGRSVRRRRRRRRRGWILLFPADWEKSVLISHQRKQTISLIEPSRKINEIGPTVERHLKVRKRKKKKQKQKQRKTIIIKRRNEFNDALFSRSKWSATVNKTCQSNPHFKQSEKNNNKEREKEEREREREKRKTGLGTADQCGLAPD